MDYGLGFLSKIKSVITAHKSSVKFQCLEMTQMYIIQNYLKTADALNFTEVVPPFKGMAAREKIWRMSGL